MSSPLAGCAIFLVEDEALIALDIAAAFEEAGAHVVISHYLSEALEIASHHDWSAAILDYALVDGDCTALCEQLIARGIPCVIYSGHSVLPSSSEICVHVAKPITPDVLVGAVDRLLRRDSNELSNTATERRPSSH
jgi:DNA-binding response OmpR family regulator